MLLSRRWFTIERDLPKPWVVINNFYFLTFGEPVLGYNCVLISKPTLEMNENAIKRLACSRRLGNDVYALDFADI